MIHMQVMNREIMMYPSPKAEPINQPIIEYMNITLIIDEAIPPKNRNERLCEKSDTAVKLPNAPIVYKTACKSSSGFTSAK